MSTTKISYQNTGYFSKMICDYLSEKESLKPFYSRFPVVNNFENQLKEKQSCFNEKARINLASQLNKQYKNVAVSEASQKNIQLLLNDNTFTITTGHQLNLFTGPLYFLYKIVSAINLASQLKKKYPSFNFVPVYWMATEDHDFEEIAYFNSKGKKFHWKRDFGGAVGELSTEGLDKTFNDFTDAIGTTENAIFLKNLFSEAYLKHSNLTDATRFLANELFKEYGLVIIDGNDAELKKAFVPFAEKELLENTSYNFIEETTKQLEEVGYKKQVHPRDINLFYLTEGLRERIIEQDGRFIINDTKISFSKDEIVLELKKHPERFSPNALLRPLYQEVILPNLCYIGGGGELAYWFQLKGYFEAVSVPFPILLLRNSAAIVSKKQAKKLEKLAVSIPDLFLKQNELLKKRVQELSENEIDFTPQRKHLQQQFENLYKVAEQTDKSFLGAVKAQEVKQLKGLDNLEKRLLKAQKRKLKDSVDRITILQDKIFPNKSLQERTVNFSEIYLEYGACLIPSLIDNLNPLESTFTVLVY